MIASLIILFGEDFADPEGFTAQLAELAAIPGLSVELTFPFSGMDGIGVSEVPSE